MDPQKNEINAKEGGASGEAAPSLLDTANVFSQLTLYWTSPLISLAYRKRLEMSDVNKVPRDMKSDDLGEMLERKWDGSFFSALRKCFLREFLWIIPPFLILCVTATVTPFLVQMFLRNLSGTQTPLSGWAIVVLIGIVGVVQAFAINTGFLLCSIISVKVRSAVGNMIFRKAIKLSSASRASLSSGDVLNLMSQDTERIFFAGLHSHAIWYATLMMVIVMIVLLIEIGVAGLAAVLFALCLMPFTAKIAAWVGTEKRQMLHFTDERVSLSSEMLQGIQTVKMQNWEEFIKSKVFAMRKSEMVHGKKVLHLLAINAWQVFMVPPLMAALCFGVLAATNPDRLNVATIYSVLAFLNALLLPLDLIPRASGAFAQAMVSIRRIERFMALKNVEVIDVVNDESKEHVSNGGSFDFPKQHVVLDSERLGEAIPKVSFVLPGVDQNTATHRPVVPAPEATVTGEDIILSMHNCTFFWTRKKDDDTHDKVKPRKLSRMQSSRKRIQRFRYSASGLRQQSFNWATSFRTGPVFKAALDEEQVAAITLQPNPPKALEMEEIDVLKGINLDIRRGELLVIVGEVGSGKTSLLQGVLGEIGVREGGDLKWSTSGRKASIAYVPQEPWIQNDSLRNNVLFLKTRPIEEEIYDQVITGVQMRPDLRTLPKGDRTEIGSRGINLSGGQKARVGLSRAVYHALVQRKQESNSSEVVVCCDDPFSALDPNVAIAVWTEVIQGLLGGFTRVVCLK